MLVFFEKHREGTKLKRNTTSESEESNIDVILHDSRGACLFLGTQVFGRRGNNDTVGGLGCDSFFTTVDLWLTYM